MAHVGSSLRGRAVEIKVRLGDLVRKDQELVVIESPELGEAQSDFLQKRSAAQSAAPQVDLAKAAWDRAAGLLKESQGISLTEVQRREAEYKAGVAAQKAAEAAASAAENRLHILGMDQRAVEGITATSEIAPRFVIRAPIDGQVVQREVTQGELVSPEREALLVLADTRTLWVLADVPEANLAEVAVGVPAWVSVGFLAGERLEAQVSFISPIVDPTTRTAQVRIDVPEGTKGNGNLHLRPGMFARAEITAVAVDGKDPKPVIAVPDEAVQTVEGGPAVFVPVAGEPNTYAKRPVTVGSPVGGLIPVLSGLAEGDQYVAAGSFILKADLGKSAAKHED
jgi:cobalt-zinc-cadmium efflux system membrane fusion protein